MHSKMPEQTYTCPKCKDTLRTRSILGASCSTPGCDWCDMLPDVQMKSSRTNDAFVVAGFIGFALYAGIIIYSIYQIAKETVTWLG